MQCTLQVYWDFRWHDAGNIVFRKPDLGLKGEPSFGYDVAYTLSALERTGNLDKGDLVNQLAVGVNLPCNFHREYFAGEISPVVRDIMPQGYARRSWVGLLNHARDPGQRIDAQLLVMGCAAPVGNLRIKEAAERLRDHAQRSLPRLDRTEIASLMGRGQDTDSRPTSLFAGAFGAGGDAPKLLLVETSDGKYTLEGTVPDSEVCRHWLVKFPRGRVSRADIAVLEGEAAVYRLLAERGVNSIPGSVLEHTGGNVALWLPRFDRVVTAEGVVRHGVESMYSLMGRIGDGARLSHIEVMSRLRACVTVPSDWDSIFVEYLVRDILNTATGNRDNHGRNMAVLKRNFEVELAPAYDVAPMVLDPEGIAASTHWPSRLLDSFRNPDYGKIVAEYADEPESAALSLIGALERLVDLRAGLQKHEAPVVMLDHPAIRMREPERVIENLRHRFAG